MNLNMSNGNPSSRILILVAVIGAAGALGAALITRQPSPPVPIPVPEVKGKWRIIENGKSKGGRLEIVWDYNSNIVNGNIRMRGQKVKVNDKSASSSEKMAISVYNLTIKDNQAEGEFEESNYQGKVLRGKVKLNFTENFTLVSGYLENDDGVGSTLLGEKQ
jgi:hypothetical protein